MRFPAWTASLLSIALLAGLAGCTGDPEGGPAASPMEPEPEGSSRMAEPATFSRIGQDIRVATCEVVVHAGAGVEGQDAYLGCAFAKAAEGDLSGFGVAVVEAEWPGAAPTVRSFGLHVVSESCAMDDLAQRCSHEQVTGTTPSLRLELDQAFLQEWGSDGPGARATLEGVAVQQKVRVAVSLFPAGQAVPAGYTAL